MSSPFNWRPWNKPVLFNPESNTYTTHRSSQPSNIKMFDSSMTKTYIDYALNSEDKYLTDIIQEKVNIETALLQQDVAERQKEIDNLEGQIDMASNIINERTKKN